jgi:hypothetical protein
MTASRLEAGLSGFPLLSLLVGQLFPNSVSGAGRVAGKRKFIHDTLLVIGG